MAKTSLRRKVFYAVTILYVIVLLIWIFYFRSSLSLDDIKRRINKLEDMDDRILDHLKSSILRLTPAPIAAPVEESYMTGSKYLSVKDQGHCGSCTAFTLSSTMATNYSKANDFKVPVLSPQMLLSCRSYYDERGSKGSPCSGWSTLRWALSLSEQEYGPFSYLPLESQVPYLMGICGFDDEECSSIDINTINSSCNPNDNNNALLTVRHEAYRVKYVMVASYTGDSTDRNINQIKSYIVLYGAVAAAINIFKDIDSVDSSPYEYTPGSDNSDLILGGHAVTIVGWRPGWWRILNSWGTSWGDKGFFWLKWGGLMNDSYVFATEVGHSIKNGP